MGLDKGVDQQQHLAEQTLGYGHFTNFRVWCQDGDYAGEGHVSESLCCQMDI